MKVGPYAIERELGAGGMGRVWLARASDGRLVVLKACLRDELDDEERLRDEARVGLRLRHPGVVDTIELLEVPGPRGRCHPVLVTAYVQGMNLLDLRQTGPLPAVVVCRLGRQLAGALDAIHRIVDDEGRSLGVLHRDVTAANCLLGDDGDARLIDFGIARSRDSRAVRTQSGLVRGTLRYLAPEIFAGAGYSVQSDLWSLGVVLFEALLARPAVTGNDVVAMGRICVGDLLELQPGEQPDPRVLRAVSMLLQKRPEDRPRSAREAAAVFAMHEKTLVQENARASSDDARSAVFLARLRTEAPTLEHLEPEPPEPIDDHGLPFPEQDEPPFARLLVTEADPTHPPLKIAPAGSTAVDDLRAYAASLSAMEKQLHHVELADESAAAAARARSAILQDTTLWAPPPGLAADLALLFVNGDDFAEPPETVHQTPSRPSPFLPQPASLVPPRVFDEVITVETPARARSAAGVMPAIEKNRSQREDVHQMIDAFLVPDDTPTPTLSPLQHRRALAAAGTAPVVAFAPTVLQRAALALLLIGFGTAVAVAAALLLR